MSIDVPTLFFDVGGVLLTNGWDTAARRRAADAFGIDFGEFQTRHEMLKTGLETGRLTLGAYLHKAVFFRHRPFSIDDFQQFMYEQSQPMDGALEFARALAATRKYRLFTLNNESRELHEYRVRTFRLAAVFEGFCTSCYLGQVKPDEEIYLNAVGIAGCSRKRAIFIDDRPLNVEPALALGLNAVHYETLTGLKEYLAGHGVEA